MDFEEKMNLEHESTEIQIIKEFRAGKMIWNGKVVQACVDKGLLQVIKDKSVYKIRWYNIDKNIFENEMNIEKGIKFEHIKESKSNSVFVIKKDNLSCHIYWLQNKNLLLDNILNELNNYVDLYSNQQNDDLNNTLRTILEEINSNKNLNENNLSNNKKLSLLNILTSDIIGILKNDKELMKELKDQMPENQNSEEDVLSAFSCPQVKYTLRLLDESIYSDQLITLSTALGLNISYDSLINSNPMEVFIKALHDKYYNKK